MNGDECDCGVCEVATCDLCGGVCDRIEDDLTATCESCRWQATLTTDAEDHYAAVRGRRRDLPDDGPEYWAYWEARIDEAWEGV